MSDLLSWFAAQTAGAPATLVARAHEYLVASPETLSPPERLRAAAESALDAAIAGGTERRAAVDLLAADALITLALLQVATTQPARLGDAARQLRHAVGEAR